MRTKISLWQAVWYVLSILFFVYIVTNIGQLGQILGILRQGNPAILLLAVAFQVAFLVNQAGAFQALYEIAGVKESLRYMITLVSAGQFAALITPTGTIGGTGYVVQAQRLRDIPSGKSLFVNVLYWLLDYLVIIVILVIGLTSLALRQDITRVQIVAAGLMGLLVLALALGIILFVEAPVLPLAVFRWILITLNRLLKLFHHSLDVARAERSIEEFRGNFSLVMKERNHLERPLIHAILNNLFLMITLALLFAAYNVPLELRVLISSFALILLFTIVSFTPSGLGFVETAGTLALSTQKVPVDSAVVIVLTYRLLTFWLPLAVGYYNSRRLHLEEWEEPTLAKG